MNSLILRNFYKYIPRRYFQSALFISGDKAKDSFAPLTPIIDCEKIFSNVEELKKQLRLRNSSIDIEAMKKNWEFFKSYKEDKEKLELNKKKNALEAEKIKGDESQKDRLSALYLKGKLIKEDLKTLMQHYYELEQTTMDDILQIPNNLDPETPDKEEKIFYEYGELETNSENNTIHLELGTNLGLIEFKNPSTFYLHGEAALLEPALNKFFSDSLIPSDWVPFSNTDFSRSILVEGCRLEHSNPETTLILEHKESSQPNHFDTLHLTGSASLYSFCGFFTKHFIDQNALPLRYFASGHQYNPIKKDGKSGLYNVSQEPALQMFIATDQDAKQEFMNTLQLLIKIYQSFNLYFRVVFIPASKLESNESLRANIQMFSPAISSYIDVGHLSLYNAYISRRLLMCYGVRKDYQFLNIVSGTVAYYHKILACLLENNQDICKFYQSLKFL